MQKTAPGGRGQDAAIDTWGEEEEEDTAIPGPRKVVVIMGLGFRV